MLMITRKKEESVLLAFKNEKGEESIVKVMVTKIQGQGRVQLGFDAPACVRIVREEIK